MAKKKKLDVYTIQPVNKHAVPPMHSWVCVGPNSTKNIYASGINKKDFIRHVAEKLKAIGHASLEIRTRDGQFQEERTYNRRDDPKSSKG